MSEKASFRFFFFFFPSFLSPLSLSLSPLLSSLLFSSHLGLLGVEPLGQLLVRVALDRQRSFNGKHLEQERQRRGAEALGRDGADRRGRVRVEERLQEFSLLLADDLRGTGGVRAHPKLGVGGRRVDGGAARGGERGDLQWLFF